MYCHTGAVKMQKEKWGNLTSVYQSLANSRSAHPSISGIRPEGQATLGKSFHFSEPQPSHLQGGGRNCADITGISLASTMLVLEKMLGKP